jgi:hypothetical protein
MKPKRMPALFVAWAFSEPGPKWRKVSEPKPRSELITIIRDQWKQNRMARIRPAPGKNEQPMLRESK